jgi:uracil-DNA glycosylase family 4
MDQDLRERLEFYRELGICEFYRRERPRPAVAEQQIPQAGRDLRAPAPPARAEPKPRVVVAQPQADDLFRALAPRETPEAIREDLGDCRRCKLHAGRNTIVFGSGNPRAEVVFVGEGPGADEDAQGLPFVGRAGQLLTEMINNSAQRLKLPLRREHVYICNVLKCRPPGNRTPEKDEADACLPFLFRQLDAIRSRAIVALGATAARALLNTNEAMARLRGRWFEFRGARLLVTYHPAYLLRDPSKKREAWEDMQMLLRFLYNNE